MSSSTACFHHGTCTSSPALTASLSSSQPYKCACTEAYTGSRCEIELPCPIQRCRHNGTCQRNSEFGYFQCLCTSDYAGSSCERGSLCYFRKNSKTIFSSLLALRTTTPPSACAILPCFNGGTCSETSIGGFVCVCPMGFAGVRCEDHVTTQLSTTPPTSTLAQITRTNDICENKTLCLNMGICKPNGVGGFLCECLNGYAGNRCEAKGE